MLKKWVGGTARDDAFLVIVAFPGTQKRLPAAYDRVKIAQAGPKDLLQSLSSLRIAHFGGIKIFSFDFGPKSQA